MSESAVHLQPAFILQHRPYRETSLLMEVFTRDFGIVPVLAKGVRKEKSKWAGLLTPFSLLQISYLDKTELKIFTQAELVSHFPLQKLALYCGFYVNELLQAFLHRYDPHSYLFESYQACLVDLMHSQTIEQTLRYFELDLLEETGYGVQLDSQQLNNQTIQPLQRYNFVAGDGIVADSLGIVSGATLMTLNVKASLTGAALNESKLLLRKMLEVHLQGKPLKSRHVLANIIRYL
ncbi:DNA repair protein RecO [Methylomonas lenta]|uniref:DNA repair protein RecO n=1 Tax=Methylomonas lenta TaxID=980561 RepID=A0A177NLD0_9GAMM|nr:DNA repair protein RecO [Methylomonas lenta]OAI18671.1 DNA repair protein RecO [Methylomonas lenta]